MSLHIDMSEVIAFGDDCDIVADLVPFVLQDAAQSLGFAVEGRAKDAAKPHRQSGSMEENIAVHPKSVSAESASVEVGASAVSDRGFPYPIVVDQGRRAGRRGGAYAGSRWFTNSVEKVKNEDADKVAALAADDLRALLRG